MKVPAICRGTDHFFLIILILLAQFYLSACSMRTLIYRNSPALISEALDDRFDLDGQQEDDAEARLAAILSWHQSTELPLISRDLRRVEALIDPEPKSARPEQDEQAASLFFSSLADRRNALQKRLWPDLSWFLHGLKPAQHQAYLKSQEDRWTKWQKTVNMDLAEYIEEAGEKVHDRIEPWFGRIANEQKKQIDGFVAAQRATDVLQLELSKASTQWLFDRLAKKLQTEQNKQTEQEVQKLLDEAFALRMGRNQNEQKMIAQRMEAYQSLIVGLLRTSSTRQRKHLKAELLDLAADIDSLQTNSKR